MKLKNYRWRIVGLLFFATTINYVDRNVISFTQLDTGFRQTLLGVKGPLSKTDIDHFKERIAQVDTAFKVAYMLGFLFMGWLIDKLRTRAGYTISITVWSLAGIATAFVGSFASMSAVRALLGIGESGHFPSAVKSVAQWFPKSERSFATGVFNAGANIGIIATALLVPYITLHYGWRLSFVITGLLGIILLVLWRTTYYQPEDHPRLSVEELDYIRADGQLNTQQVNLSWVKLLGYKQTWACCIGKFMTDPVWWFFLTWLPDFFNSNEALSTKLDLKSVGIPFLVIYIVSDLGSVFFGYLSSTLIQKGWSVNAARKTTMIVCAICVTPIFFASSTHNIFIAIGLIALATAAHQGWSGHMYTLTSDLFPQQLVGSVAGLSGMSGALGGVILAATTGFVRVHYGYQPLFIFASCTYVVGFIIIHLLLPKLEKANLDESSTTITLAN